MALVVDSGALYAALDRRERFYPACRALLQGTPERLVVPSPVLVEVDHLMSRRLQLSVSLRFLGDIVAGAYDVEDLVSADYRRIRDLCERYADARVGFVDAAVLAIVERLEEPKLATLDRRHFALMRPRHVDSLVLLPEL